MAEMIRVLEARGGLTVDFWSVPNSSYGEGGQHAIHWNPDLAFRSDTGVWMSPARGLGHELGHAAHPGIGNILVRFESPRWRYDNLEEFRVISDVENPWATATGLLNRSSHHFAPVPYWRQVPNPTSTP